MNLTTILRTAQASIKSHKIFTSSANKAASSRKSKMTSFLLVFSLLFSLLRVESGWGQVSAYVPTITSGTYLALGTSGSQIIVANTDDGNSAATNIGFPFIMGGQVFTQFVANSNGHIRLGGTATTNANAYTPISSTANTYAISAAGTDGRATGGVRYFVSGTAPSRVGIIEYLNFDFPYSSFSRRVSFQIRLNEETNIIDIIYTGATGTNATASLQVGLRGTTTATDVRNYSASSSGWATLTAGTTAASTVPYGSSQNATRSMPSNGRILRWTPPPALTSFSPSSQCKGSNITITGTNFSSSAVTGVTINGVAVSFSVDNSTTITAVTSASQTSGVVAVTYSGGSSSSSASLTMNDLPTITASGSVNAVCSSSSSQSSTFSYAAAANSPTSYTIDWNAAANTAGMSDVNTTSYSFIAGGGSFTVPIGANVLPGVYSGVSNNSGPTWSWHWPGSYEPHPADFPETQPLPQRIDNF
jgi:hypothetical protein